MRLELTRRNRHYPLKVACLPIPPSAHFNYVPKTRLELAQPKPLVPETSVSTNSTIWAINKSIIIREKKSETRTFRY